MARREAVRAAVAVAVLVTPALWANAQFLVQTVRLHARLEGQDLATYYQARFKPLRPLLPRHGIVGYVSDGPDATREYYLTQYALAPLVLDRTAARSVVVGNFFDPRHAPAIAARWKLVLLRDLGEGVMLYRGPGQ